MPEINWDFIRELEGFELSGYVPQDKKGNVLGKSGVTVGSGFDLGQQKDLSSYKFSKKLLEKLWVHVGITGEMAKAMLAKHPFTLTKEEGDELDKKVKEVYTNRIIKQFEDNSDLTFRQLSTAKQTVYVSVAYQYGDLKKRCPKFFKLATKGMWRSVVAELEDFGDAYTKRRRKEANYLRADLNGKGSK